jgi:hypothetical protein
LERPSRRVRVATLTLLVSICSCTNPDAVQLRLQALPEREQTDLRLAIRAQVEGDASKLQYNWSAVSGVCDPQQSDSASTMFSFAEGSAKDRVTLEVWRDDKRVGESDIEVTLDQRRAKLAMKAERPKIEILVTQVPPYEPSGGSSTRATISGRINGERGADDVLILYARADLWYRQPVPDAEIRINPDGTWTSWTHTGGSYAVLLVKRDSDFFGRYDVLPALSGLVLARTIVQGAGKP